MFLVIGFLGVALGGCDSSEATADATVGLDSAGMATVDAGAPDATEWIDTSLDGGGSLDAEPILDSTKPAQVATIVVLPDTQSYSVAFPEIFLAQTEWIAAQARPHNIQAVLQLGDIVETYDDTGQWTNAWNALRKLDGIVPYVLVPGNHDESGDLNLRDTIIDNYFAPNTMPWIGGTFETGRIENNYALIDIGSHKYLVIGLEWGPRAVALAWANAILKSYAAYPAIIVTHAFLYGNARYDWAREGANQPWNPHASAIDYAARNQVPVADVHDGEEIYQEIVLPNPNVRMVFSGHVLGDSTFGSAGRVSDLRADGTHIHQMQSNYQTVKKDGQDCGLGYLRILELDPGKKEIRVRTYSPYLDRDLTLGDNTFSLPLDDI